MQFVVKRDILLKSLNFVQGIVEKKNTLPILSNVLLQLKDQKLSIIATDLDIIFYDEITDVKVINEGSTYVLDQSHSSNSGHPIRISTTSDGIHGGGVEYTTNVTYNGTPGNAGAYTMITVASGAPTLYYYCTNHSGMGGQANTP